MDRFLRRTSSSHADEPGMAAVLARADQGDAEAQFTLGLHHGNAAGDSSDFIEAARWYLKAADQGHTLAQYNLGVMFGRGQGVPRDDATSAVWFRKAAEGGDPGAQHDLGVLCHRASVDPLRVGREDARIEAYKWLHLAAAQEYKDSVAAWERLTFTMTREEISEGNRRVAGFVVRKRASVPPP